MLTKPNKSVRTGIKTSTVPKLKLLVLRKSYPASLDDTRDEIYLHFRRPLHEYFSVKRHSVAKDIFVAVLRSGY